MSFIAWEAIRASLKSKEINAEEAANIGYMAGCFSSLVFQDHHTEFSPVAEDILEVLENLIATDSDALTNKASDIAASVVKQNNHAVNNLYSIKIKEIFSQIDLSQARNTKDQEEIHSLAKETDELLNQLEFKAS